MKRTTPRRESEATLENISDAAWRVKHAYDLPDGWEGDVYSWLSDSRQSAVENRDDQGGYPKRMTCGQRSTPWAMSRSKSKQTDTAEEGVIYTFFDGA